jgi:nitroimidazol reductase NimA-like FMN-containing flavoprotein (pyridoxamine 5'-phosphate oxidase superfamily)
MRRSEKEITERSVIDEIINRCLVCRLGLSDDGAPYVVPMNFGYEGNTVFLHAAREGKKLDILRRNNRVCVEFDTDVEIVRSDEAVGWSARYACVIGAGTASLVDDPAEKRAAYDVLMRHYAGKTFAYPDACVDRSIIITITLDWVTGKLSV